MRGESRRGHFSFTALAERLVELADCGVFPLCSCHLQGHITATPLLWPTSTATMIPLTPASQDPAARPQMAMFSCREYDPQSVPFRIGRLILNSPGRFPRVGRGRCSVLVGRLSSLNPSTLDGDSRLNLANPAGNTQAPPAPVRSRAVRMNCRRTASSQMVAFVAPTSPWALGQSPVGLCGCRCLCAMVCRVGPPMRWRAVQAGSLGVPHTGHIGPTFLPFCLS